MRRTESRALLPLLCGVFLFSFCAVPVRSEVVAPRAVESGFVIVTAETAEVREGPSPDAEVIAVVDKGEIFEKLGRTMRWYLVKIDDEITGWVSGRYIRRYQEGASPSPYVGSPEQGPYPYYNYYEYPSYYWGQPFFSADWFFYDRGWYGDPWWNHGRRYPPPPPVHGWPPPHVGPGGGAPPPPVFRPGGATPASPPPPGGGVPGGGWQGGGGPPPGGGMRPAPGPSGGMRPPSPRR